MMHQKAKDRYEQILRGCKASQVDIVLDQYADSLLRATEWDAKQWGFDPDRWMEKERVALARRGGRDWPSEVI